MEELDANENKIRDIEVTGHKFDKYREFYITNLDRAIIKDNLYRITMDFIAQLSDNLKGFYRSQYQDKATGETK